MTGHDAIGQRRDAAAHLSSLLESHEAFSFIRLGDGETWWLLHVQDGKPPPKYRFFADKAVNVEHAASTSGLETRHYERFRSALEQATYLDYCDSIPKVREHLPQLRFSRPERALRNATAATSNILFEWTTYELKGYLARHTCVLASAESDLLAELLTDPHYREIARGFVPESANLRLHQVRDHGRNYSENLDLIKADLRREIEESGADTVLLSLATGAKILCHELAEELGIRALDFGSMVRGLCYAASPGYQTHRNLHNPFLFRVPLEVFAPALERARPDLAIAELVARIHAQILLELQDLAPLRFNTTDAITGVVDTSRSRLDAFWRSRRFYDRNYRSAARRDPEARELDDAFDRWCLKKGLGLRGSVFRVLVKARQTARWLLGGGRS